ncbi:MAG: hypothetical protein LPJ91_10925 [Pseudazoarcus pumilus]|nr:hypothetical protein [Pseudazoarcus pumilus]
MEQQSDTLASVFGNVIYAYTRADAITDGTLVDVSQLAREAGFRIPVAMTTGVWADCVEWTEADSQRQTQQDEPGRLWDVLWMASLAARRATGTRCPFQVYRIPRGGRSRRAKQTTLHLHIGPGDAGEPVITILLPAED